MRYFRALVVVGMVSTVALTGCRSLQRRVQSRYRYPPPKSFYESAAAQQKAATAEAPVQSPAKSDAAATAPRPATVQPASARPAAARPAAATASAVEPAVTSPVVAPVPRLEPAPRSQPSRPAASPVPAPASDESSAAVYRLKEGDPVIVYLRGIPGVPGGEQIIENIVNEAGQIQLPYIASVSIGGKTTTEAGEIIRRAYIDQQIYRTLTVNVAVPARSYYIRGEVRQPGRFPLVGSVTLLQAIAAAGGYSEFANRRNVEILRGEKRIPVNMQAIERSPDQDRPVEPGDVIIVNRSFF